jgi:hypothetical protein
MFINGSMHIRWSVCINKTIAYEKDFAEKSKELLRDTMNYKSCEARGLQIACKLPFYSKNNVPCVLK